MRSRFLAFSVLTVAAALAGTGLPDFSEGSAPSLVQTPFEPFATRPVLTLERARLSLDAALAEAHRLDAGGAIAVVDDGGHLLCLVRIDGTFPAAAEVATDKARTAAVFRRPTKDFEDAIRGGRTTLLAVGPMTPLEGGIPILIDGQVVGAVGVSGAHSSTEDVQIAAAGQPAQAQHQPTPPARALSAAAAPKILVNRDKNGVAIGGYDPVAYFTDGKPVKGDPKFNFRYKGAVYHFASAAHQAMFAKDPAKYCPAFGGYCGYAASINRLSPINPEYWQIIEGRLVLQHNQKALDAWNMDVPANLVKADKNWPSLVDRNGVTDKVLVNVDDRGVAIEGHDPVAYFTLGTPTKGSPEFSAVYNGATYYFVSMENRVSFEQAPAHYAPAFGGFCGYAASINKISPVDPTLFQIIDDRLVLQHTPKAYSLFNDAPDRNLSKADKNWPGLVSRKGK